MSFGGGGSDAVEQFNAQQRGIANQARDYLYSVADQLAGLGQDYFNEYISPVLGQIGDQANIAIDNFDQLRQTSLDWANVRNDVFETQGIAGLNAFMDRALNFNEGQYAAEEGSRAIGDINTQEAAARESFNRALSSRGVNASSGQALSVAGQMGINSSLAKASAWSQARKAAQVRGDQFAQAAGNMGLQLSGLAAPYLQQAGAYTGAGVDVANARIPGLQLGLNSQQGGLQAAGSLISPIYQSASSNQAGAVQTIAQQDAQNQQGWGNLLGRVAGVGIGLATGNTGSVVRGLLS